MSEESRVKLQEASKHFAAGNYQMCEDILVKIPGGNDDPKVAHNIALCSYLSKGGDCSAVLSLLGGGTSGTTSVTSGDLKFLDDKTPCFDYEGQEVALVNQAAICLHNGEATKGLNILQALARSAHNFAPVVKARIAVLLHCTATAAGKNQKGTSQVVMQLISGAESELKADASLMKMTQLALGDASALENWYNNSTDKTPTDRCVMHNNLGVKTAERGKSHLACLHFALSLKNLSEVAEKDRDIFLLESILYNFGLMSLSHGTSVDVVSPQAVLDAFLTCQRTMEGSAKLWWHIAQVSSWWLIEETSNSTLECYRRKQVELHEQIRSSGAVPSHTQLLSLPSKSEMVGSGISKDSKEAGGAADAHKWSEMGLLAVKNALFILQGHTNTNTGLLQQLWVLGAFFENARRNYSVALKYSNEVISTYLRQRKQTVENTHPALRIDNGVMITALSYAVESLCFVNRPAQAVKLLQSVSLGDLLSNTESQGSFQCPGAKKDSVDALFINLAVTHIANGNYKQAYTIATNVVARAQQQRGSSNSGSGSHGRYVTKAGVILQSVLELAQGNKDRAVELIAKTPVQPPFVK